MTTPSALRLLAMQLGVGCDFYYPLLGAATLALPGLEPLDAAWLLPALALTVTALAEPSGRIYTILHAAGGLAGEKPQLVGLPSKWRLISTENDVCLAKRVGTCLTVY